MRNFFRHLKRGRRKYFQLILKSDKFPAKGKIWKIDELRLRINNSNAETIVERELNLSGARLKSSNCRLT